MQDMDSNTCSGTCHMTLLGMEDIKTEEDSDEEPLMEQSPRVIGEMTLVKIEPGMCSPPHEPLDSSSEPLASSSHYTYDSPPDSGLYTSTPVLIQPETDSRDGVYSPRSPTSVSVLTISPAGTPRTPHVSALNRTGTTNDEDLFCEICRTQFYHLAELGAHTTEHENSIKKQKAKLKKAEAEQKRFQKQVQKDEAKRLKDEKKLIQKHTEKSQVLKVQIKYKAKPKEPEESKTEPAPVADTSFKCNHCDSAYINKRSLSMHSRAHPKCTGCKLRFPTKGDLTKHTCPATTAPGPTPDNLLTPDKLDSGKKKQSKIMSWLMSTGKDHQDQGSFLSVSAAEDDRVILDRSESASVDSSKESEKSSTTSEKNSCSSTQSERKRNKKLRKKLYTSSKDTPTTPAVLPEAATAPTVTATAPTVTATAPTMTATAPTVTATAPTVTATAPTVTVTAPTVTATAPFVTATAPSVTATAPSATATFPTVTATAPSVTATAPSVTTTSPTVTSNVAADYEESHLPMKKRKKSLTAESQASKQENSLPEVTKITEVKRKPAPRKKNPSGASNTSLSSCKSGKSVSSSGKTISGAKDTADVSNSVTEKVITEKSIKVEESESEAVSSAKPKSVAAKSGATSVFDFVVDEAPAVIVAAAIKKSPSIETDSTSISSSSSDKSKTKKVAASKAKAPKKNENTIASEILKKSATIQEKVAKKPKKSKVGGEAAKKDDSTVVKKIAKKRKSPKKESGIDTNAAKTISKKLSVSVTDAAKDTVIDEPESPNKDKNKKLSSAPGATDVADRDVTEETVSDTASHTGHTSESAVDENEPVPKKRKKSLQKKITDTLPTFVVVPKKKVNEPKQVKALKAKDNFDTESDTASLVSTATDDTILAPSEVSTSDESILDVKPKRGRPRGRPKAEGGTKKLTEEELTCQTCCSIFGNIGLLKNHIRGHRWQHPHICGSCGIPFDSALEVKQHNKVHTEGKPFKCNDCDSAFTRRFFLELHMRTHTGERPFNCNLCEKAFAQSSHLKMHLKVHSGEKPRKCEVCGVCFVMASKLKDHMRIHTGEKPFKCHLCPKDFAQAYYLKIHLRTHSGDKPYKCTVCGHGFRQSCHVIIHMRTHTGENPYSCDDCGTKFRHSPLLKKHKKLGCGVKGKKEETADVKTAVVAQ